MTRSVALGSVARIDRNGVDPALIAPGTAYVGLEHVSGDGQILDAPAVDPGELASTKFQFSNRHVLFGKLRPYLRKVTRPAFSGICSTDILPILPSERLDRDYLYHFLRTDEAVRRATALATGVNLPRLSPKDLLSFEIRLPSIEEQRRLAVILDRADELRQKRKAALRCLSALPKAVYQEMFATFSGPWTKVSNLIRDDDRINYGIVQPGPDLEAGVPVVRVVNIVENDFRYLSLKKVAPDIEQRYGRSRLKGDEILVACVGSVGAISLAEHSLAGANIARAVARIPVDPRKANRIFIAEFLKLDVAQHYFKSETRTVAQPTLNIKQLAETLVPCPSLTAQDEFAERVLMIHRVEQKCLEQGTGLDALFASLQHRAFSGAL